MNSTTASIVWVCLVAAFVVIMLFAGRAGDVKPGDDAVKSSGKKSRPPDAAQTQAGSADKQP